VASLLLLAGPTGCGSDAVTRPPPFPPADSAKLAVLGDTIQDTVWTRTPVTYWFHTDSQMVATIFFEADTGRPYLTMSEGGVATVHDSVDGEPLLHSRSQRVLLQPGDAHRLTIQPYALLGGIFRFVVSRVSLAPETLVDSIVVDSSYAGESFENSADIDEFTFEGRPGDLYVAYLQAMEGQSLGSLDMYTVQPRVSWDDVYEVTNSQPSTDLQMNATATFQVSAPGRSTFVLQCLSTTATVNHTSCGQYRFEVRRVDPAPEGVGPVLALNDSATSALEYSGDIDEYNFTAPAGSMVQVFLRTESTVPDGRSVQAVWTRGSYEVDAFTAAVGEGGVHGVNSHQGVSNGAPCQLRIYGARPGTRAVYTLFVSVTP
jgi:hypothetical protein